jgi:leucine dehydrogenase
MTQMETRDFEDFEQVQFCRDRQTGLSTIIAIHDTSLGPAAGGCRMWPYTSESEALRDVLRLARGMSLKSAMAELPLGGGKSVILGDPRHQKSPELLRAFGRFVESLGGRYLVAEDVGITVRDVEVIAGETRYAAGLSRGAGSSGDPSPLTAQGVHAGIRAAVAHRLGREDLRGLRVAVQGVGAVGFALCRMLHAEGASLVVADVSCQAVARAVECFGARALAPDEIVAADVDVFAPCALGAVIDDTSLPRIRAVIVAGSANNQLAEARHGDALHARGILYAPDYVINAGGIVNVACELAGSYDPDEALELVARIGPRLSALFAEADAKGEPPSRVADRMARARLAAARSRQTPRAVAAG